MSRLIDADKLIEDLKKIHITVNGMRSGKSFTIDILERYEEEIKKTINNQPAAYNVDKVVEQLEEENALYCAKFIICKKKGNDTLAKENLDRANLLDKAIEVVKAGGIDE